eukprot:GHVO01016332.1.p1 GENE.GHVO01016332.1~~GHVO01016332.1.p1  ORF type:complete len:909 (+),score=193.53 GHVO01016332.1:366-3092(+)
MLWMHEGCPSTPPQSVLFKCLSVHRTYVSSSFVIVLCITQAIHELINMSNTVCTYNTDKPRRNHPVETRGGDTRSRRSISAGKFQYMDGDETQKSTASRHQFVGGPYEGDRRGDENLGPSNTKGHTRKYSFSSGKGPQYSSKPTSPRSANSVSGGGHRDSLPYDASNYGSEDERRGVTDADKKLVKFRQAEKAGKAVCVCGASSYYEREKITLMKERQRLREEWSNIRDDQAEVARARHALEEDKVHVSLKKREIDERNALAMRKLQDAEEEFSQQASLRLEARKLRDQLEADKRVYQEKTNEVNEKAMEVDCARRTLAEQKSHVNAKSHKLQAEIKQNQELLVVLEAKKKEHERYFSKITETEMNVKAQQNAIREREERLEDSTLKLQEAEMELDERAKTLKTAEEDYETIRSAFERERAKIERENERLTDTLKIDIENLEKDKNEFKACSEKIESDRQELDNRSDQIKEAQHRIEKRTREVEKGEKHVSSEIDRLSALEDHLKQQNEQLNTREKDLEETYRANTELERILRDREVQLTERDTTLEKDVKEYDSRSHRLVEKEQHIADMEDNLKIRVDRVKEMEVEMNRLKVDLLDREQVLEQQSIELDKRHACLNDDEMKSVWMNNIKKEASDQQEMLQLQQQQLDWDKRMLEEKKKQFDNDRQRIENEMENRSTEVNKRMKCAESLKKEKCFVEQMSKGDRVMIMNRPQSAPMNEAKKDELEQGARMRKTQKRSASTSFGQSGSSRRSEVPPISHFKIPVHPHESSQTARSVPQHREEFATAERSYRRPQDSGTRPRIDEIYEELPRRRNEELPQESGTRQRDELVTTDWNQDDFTKGICDYSPPVHTSPVFEKEDIYNCSAPVRSPPVEDGHKYLAHNSVCLCDDDECDECGGSPSRCLSQLIG